MVSHCLESGEPFGIVLRDDDGSARRIGCEARIEEVIERFEDGRLNIIVAGERPFKVLERFEAPGFPAGEIEPIEVGSPAEDDDVDAAELARTSFAELVSRVAGEPPEPGELAGEDSYAIASRVELPTETKQRLLELRSEAERMRVLGRALRALLNAVSRSEEIAERARMNGKVIVGGPDVVG